MKILLDLGHPAHVHYFRNFIRISESSGNKILVVARNRSLIFELLKKYNIEFETRGRGGRGLIGKLFYIFLGTYWVTKHAFKFKPDIFLSFGSTYASLASFILMKPHIVFDDTEHASLEQLLYVPFANVIFTPNNFRKNFGRKHLRFNGSMDLAYLHPAYFKPDITVYDMLGINREEKYIIMRFVSWGASHDVGYKGLKESEKIRAVETLSKHCRIFISSESALPPQLNKYQINIPCEKMHDALFYAEMFWGESGTMATEAAIMGTPAIDIATSAKLVGVFDPYIEAGLISIITDADEAISKALEYLATPKKAVKKHNVAKELFNNLDITDLMVWFVLNYPSSYKIIKSDPTVIPARFNK
jgi:predicted glycosyltransferase